MKKIIVLIFVPVFIFCGCTAPIENNNIIEQKEIGIVKSVWITYYELENMLKNKTKDEFTDEFTGVVSEIKELGFNTITVQVKAFADAFYNSKYYPSSSYFVAHQGDSIPFDPLSIICEIANVMSISVEAWVNPYRVSNNTDFNELSNDNPAYKWKNTDNTIVTESGIFFNPASSEVTELITNGVKEIVEKYNISAIHFDDYFYPTDIKELDLNSYKKSKSELSLKDWRRDNVNNMLKSVSKAIKSYNKNTKFGVSPSANIDENRNTLYANVEEWVGNKALLDYICPQIYYGFKNETMPFMFTTKKWLEICSIDMYVGLPLYKAGKEDKYAGVGKNEFKKSDIISRQIDYLSKIDGIKGIYIFSYSSIKGHESELSKLKEI